MMRRPYLAAGGKATAVCCFLRFPFPPSRSGRLRMALLSVLSLLCLSPFPAHAQVDTENVINMGRSALGYDDNVTAIHYFNQAIEAKPFLYKPYYFRAYAKFSLGDYHGAEADCTKAIGLNPYIVEIFQLRGICRINNNDFDGAIADYTRTLSELPDEQSALFNRGLCYVQQKRYDEAAADMDGLLARHPHFYRAYMVKAQVALERGDTLQGLAWVDTLLAHKPDEASAWAFKGRHAYRQSLFGLADSCLTRAVRLRPRDYESYVVRALARHGMNLFGKAIEDYDKVIELVPQHFVAHYNRGLLRALVGDDNRALEDFDFVIAREPDDVLAVYNRALLRQQTGDYRGAIADYSRLIKEYPDFLAGYLARAECRRKTGDVRGALNDESIVSRANLDLTFGQRRRPVRKVRRRSDHSLDKYEQLVEEDADTMAAPLRNLIAGDWVGKVQNRKEQQALLPMFAFSFKQPSGQGHAPSAFMSEAARFGSLFRSSPLQLTAGTATARPDDLERLQQQLSDTSLPLTAVERLFLSAVLHRDLYDAHSALSDVSDALSAHPDSALSVVLHLQQAVLLAEAAQQKATPAPAAPASAAAVLSESVRAHQALEQALALSPLNPFLHYNRGCLSAADADGGVAAVAAFTRAIELDSRFAEAYYNRGVLHLQRGEKAQAVTDFSRAGELGLYKAYSLLKQARE